ncbi:MAG TPA: methyltransferase domain-containing protein [Vicinamibacterales bacterium]|nr:methyltransferase domain-containing protein [Vicinamibacterales bacterium]
MTITALLNRGLVAALAAMITVAVSAQAPAPAPAQQKPFEPSVGQAGKDVVWVPTADVLVAKMLDMAKLTPQDYLIDLGSGDGRTVIAAAKRGATAMGIEYNPDMVELSKKNAAAAGVAGKATFVKADIFESDYSKATVLTLFLLPQLNLKLRPTILDMKPGTRVVSNSFNMEDWEPDDTARVETECTSWCTAYLWIVPAKVDGTWTSPNGNLTLKQNFQMVTGTLGSNAISNGRLRGTELTFTAGNTKYVGQVNGNTIKGTAGSAAWSATKK